MKFNCSRDSLNEALASAGRVVSSHATLDVLKGVLLMADERGLTVTGNDMDISLTMTLDAEVTEPGSCVLEAKIFSDIIRRLPDEWVSVEIDAQYKVSITSGASDFSILAMSGERYPALPEVDGLRRLTLTQPELKRMLEMTTYAVATNDKRVIQTGVLFEAEPAQLTLVAIDGHRVAICKREMAIGDSFSFVVPAEPLSEVERLLGSDEEQRIDIDVSTKHAVFTFGQAVVITRLLEGEFMKYRNAVPQDFSYETKVNVRTLMQSVERVSLLINDKLKNPIRLNFNHNELTLSCITGMGRAVDTLPIEPGGELEIGFNNRYVLDALRHVPDETVVLRCNGALTPMTLTPPEGDEFIFLILPVRLKAE